MLITSAQENSSSWPQPLSPFIFLVLGAFWILDNLSQTIFQLFIQISSEAEFSITQSCGHISLLPFHMYMSLMNVLAVLRVLTNLSSLPACFKH